jgi:GNAT superfamily N-acetyltransferase
MPKWNPHMPPEFLDNWVFLTMDRTAMRSFLKGGPPEADSGGGSTAEMMSGGDGMGPSLRRSVVERAIHRSLTSVPSHGGDQIRLRLAGPDDVDDIARLVMQLAVYEKEPDAVHVTARDYLLDGSSDEPLFFCLLADAIHADDDHGDGVGRDGSTTGTKAAATCGMGLFFLGYILEEGRPYLYLEDLFFEQERRGLGGGKKMMQQIARIALDLGCCRFIWTALDWNTPALNFYSRIGAKLHDDVKITRYCGRETLLAFANESREVGDKHFT